MLAISALAWASVRECTLRIDSSESHSLRRVIEDDPEERGARILFRSFFQPRWFADLLWRTWLRRKRRREERTRLRSHS